MFQVLAAICLIPNGHEKVLEAITMAGESSRKPRLLPIIEGLELKTPESLKVGSKFVTYRIIDFIVQEIKLIFDITDRLHATDECDHHGTGGIGIQNAFTQRVYANWTL